MTATSYLIGLGSNRPHGRHGRPAQVVAAAVRALAAEGLRVERSSAIIASRALGPGGRDYANAVVLMITPLDPPALLGRLKQMEQAFGRRRGRRWGARVLDLDILAWSGGRWPPGRHAPSRLLTVPHVAFTQRGFALGPAASIAPRWRLPRGGRLAALDARLRRDVDRRRPRS